MRKKKPSLISPDTSPQHTTPCHECPWRRKALAGWLGPCTAEEWVQHAHGETVMHCHMNDKHQCAGAAIFRANVCKEPRYPTTLTLPADTVKVFGSDVEFIAHHNV